MTTVYSGDKLKKYLTQNYQDISTVKYELYNLSKKEDSIDSLSNENLYFLVKQNPEPIVVECKLFENAKEVEDYRSKPLANYEQVILHEILKGEEVNKYHFFYEQLELAASYAKRFQSKEFSKEDIDEKAFYMFVEDVILKIKLEL
ncbi:hypothetical protein RZN22_14150 [Bacillaceae bacterium S4-13-58]